MWARGQSVRAFAPAKINLYLEVLGRRSDGYHRLDSLVVFASVGDQITLAPAEAFSLQIDGPFAESLKGEATEDNLVFRAARALAAAAGEPPPVAIHLTKTLPVASGIGGGSADAAAVLRALRKVWSLDWPVAKLLALAAGLGADVPACLISSPLRFEEIGDRITPIAALPKVPMVLVNPGVAVSTPSVFRHPALTFSPPVNFPERFADREALVAWLKGRRNDLQAPALALVPAIGEALAALDRLAGIQLARMSGSGATCFALFDNMPAATAGAEALRRAYPSWWISVAESIELEEHA